MQGNCDDRCHHAKVSTKYLYYSLCVCALFQLLQFFLIIYSVMLLFSISLPETKYLEIAFTFKNHLAHFVFPFSIPFMSFPFKLPYFMQ